MLAKAEVQPGFRQKSNEFRRFLPFQPGKWLPTVAALASCTPVSALVDQRFAAKRQLFPFIAGHQTPWLSQCRKPCGLDRVSAKQRRGGLAPLRFQSDPHRNACSRRRVQPVIAPQQRNETVPWKMGR